MKNTFSKIKIISTNKIAIALFVFIVLALFSAKMVFAVWNGTFYDPGDTLNPECLPTDVDCDVRSPLTSTNISDTAYDATTWNGVTTIAPSKNAIRDQIEILVASNHNPITLGTANGLSLATQILSLALASTSTTGALSDTDWDTFNNKAPALGADDNYVTDAQLIVVGNTSGTNTGDNAANSSTMYVGTTAIALNRASAALALTGITGIDGNAATVTNAVLTTALTNNGGAGTLTWPVAGATLTIPTGGGTLGTAAFTSATAYEASGAIATHAALTTGVHGLAITAGQTLTVTTGGTLGSNAYTSTAYVPYTGATGDLVMGAVEV